MLMRFRILLSLTLVVALGCGSNDPARVPTGKPTPSPSEPATEAAHVHAPGPHGGKVIDWGGGKYHVEFTVDHDKKQAVIYVLGSDEKTPTPIKAEMMTITIDDPAAEIEAAAQPLEGETDGLSSRFVGAHDALGAAKEYAGSISGLVDGIPYTGEFNETAHND
jgi:hypothetical protein